MKAKWLIGALVLVAMPVLGQTTSPAGTSANDASGEAQLKFQIRIMEGVLENAVQHGAQTVSVQMRQVSPDIAFFSGPARARGFRLEGYGILFAVDVPTLHRSVTWSVRTLTQSNADLSRALKAIRRMVQTQNDARMKTELEQALRLVELQVGPPTDGPAAATGPVVTRAASTADGTDSGVGDAGLDPAVAEGAGIMANPSGAYTDAVQHALIDAMLDYGPTLSLGDAEWLTIAARENTDTMLSGDLTESATITLRVKATDLEAFKAGRLARDEVRQRVEVREF